MNEPNIYSAGEALEPMLLVDGKEAFPEILRCISAARRSIRINMFIWRDDAIGNCLAKALLEAAERGVNIAISVDRYGMVLELCEEGKASFFHRNPTWTERAKIRTLELFYPMKNAASRWSERQNPLLSALLSHPKVSIERDAFKADHSKYYVFDDEIVILGGINVEDKENGADRQGRTYQDYMIKITDAGEVGRFLARMDDGIPHPKGHIVANTKRTPTRFFEAKAHYLSMLNEATSEITVTMAYFSPLRSFTDALVSAARCGVRVTVLIPEHANFQDDSNRKTVRRLLRQSHGAIRVLLCPKMVHTKLIANERRISFGSTNITKKAFRQLDELNWCVENRDTAFVRALLASVRENQALSREVTHPREITYRPWMAFLEGFLV